MFPCFVANVSRVACATDFHRGMMTMYLSAMMFIHFEIVFVVLLCCQCRIDWCCINKSTLKKYAPIIYKISSNGRYKSEFQNLAVPVLKSSTARSSCTCPQFIRSSALQFIPRGWPLRKQSINLFKCIKTKIKRKNMISFYLKIFSYINIKEILEISWKSFVNILNHWNLLGNHANHWNIWTSLMWMKMYFLESRIISWINANQVNLGILLKIFRLQLFDARWFVMRVVTKAPCFGHTNNNVSCCCTITTTYMLQLRKGKTIVTKSKPI